MPPPKFEYKSFIEKLSNLFREHGYHGTTFSIIQEASGLGKGSLYHHFTNGKEDIARAVLMEIHHWFEENIYSILEQEDHSTKNLDVMYKNTILFFHGGSRVCVPGSFALHDARDQFPQEIEHYFTRWIDTLSGYLHRKGIAKKEAQEFALTTVTLIQGGLVLGRALQNPAVFITILNQDKKKLKQAILDA